MKFQKQIEEAIIKANNWSHYEPNEAYAKEYDELLVKKWEKTFQHCINRSISAEEIHQIKVFADNLPQGLLRVIGEIYHDFRLD